MSDSFNVVKPSATDGKAQLSSQPTIRSRFPETNLSPTSIDSLPLESAHADTRWVPHRTADVIRAISIALVVFAMYFVSYNRTSSSGGRPIRTLPD